MSAFRHLWPHFRRQAPLFTLGVVALLTTNLLQQALPLLLLHAIDNLRGGAAIAAVVGWALLRLGAIAAQGGLRYGWRMGFFGMGRQVEYGMRRQFFEKLLSLSPDFFQRLRVGDLLSRAMSDLVTVRESLGFGWLALLDGVTMISFTIFFMLRLDSDLTLWSLLPLTLIPFLVITLGRRVRQGSIETQACLDQLSQAATESFSGVKVLHAFARQKEELGRFKALAENYRAVAMRLVRIEAYYWPLLAVLSGIAELVLFYRGGQRVAAGTLSLGSFAAMNDYLLAAVWPLMALGFSTNIYMRGRVSLERLNDVYDSLPSIDDKQQATDTFSADASVVHFENVGARYTADGPWVLKGLSLEIKAGEWVGLAGRTGAGKTSLLRLIPRLADPDEGQVFFKGRDIRDWSLTSLRASIGVVAQEPFVFSETLLENVGFAEQGDPAARLEEILAAAKAADLHDTVLGFPQGYETMLGERGVNLSGGQRQRLALARAFFKKPSLLLLDDAFSAVDTATEERIVTRLRAALPDTAVVLVSHRSSTLRLCDRVLVLADGHVVQSGDHASLVTQEGYYAEMTRRERLAAQAGLG